MTTSAPKRSLPDHPYESFDGWPTSALLRAARDTYKKAIRDRLAEAGFEDLPSNGPFILGAITNRGVAPSDAIQMLGVTKQAASQLVDLLAVRGYIERAPDAADRRRMTLEPTERGRAAGKAVSLAVDEIDRELGGRLNRSEFRTFRAGLIALIELGVSGGPPGERPARLIQFSPVFPVKDLQRALDHYRSLGFSVRPYHDGGYGFADRDGIGLHLSLKTDHEPQAGPGEAYLYVEDADALAAEWSRAGVGGRTLKVRKTPYGYREGVHVDPDDNVIRFGSLNPV